MNWTTLPTFISTITGFLTRCSIFSTCLAVKGVSTRQAETLKPPTFDNRRNVIKISSRAARLASFIAIMSAQFVFAQEECVSDLNGIWTVTETVTLTNTIDGESETNTEIATGDLELIQDGCNIRYFQSGPFLPAVHFKLSVRALSLAILLR